jgi:hypothetical protein
MSGSFAGARRLRAGFLLLKGHGQRQYQSNQAKSYERNQGKHQDGHLVPPGCILIHRDREVGDPGHSDL